MALPQKSSSYNIHPTKKIYDKEKSNINISESIDSKSFEVIEKDTQKEKTSLITFEGGKDFCSIPNIKTNVTTVELPNWISLIQNKNEECTNAENIASSNTVASWGKCKNEQDNIRYILFNEPVSSVSLHYSSYFPIKICAYDSNDKLIATIQGSKNWSSESGYSDFNELTMNQNKDIIKHLKIESFAEYLAIDNLKISKNSQISDDNSTKSTSNNENASKKDNNKSEQSKTFDKLFIALSLYLLFSHNSNGSIIHNMRGPMIPNNKYY